MLEPLSQTDVHLTSILAQYRESSEILKSRPDSSGDLDPHKPNAARKRVTFTEEGIRPPVRLLTKAMERAKEQAKRKVPFAPKASPVTTPPLSDPSKLRSSCTWSHDEVDRLNINVQRDVNVTKMIPVKFFKFQRLHLHEEGISSLVLLTSSSSRYLCSV
jgi:hypothetical protein